MVKFGLLAPSIATIKAITMKEGSGANNNEKNKVLQEEDIDYDPDCISTISSDDSNSDPSRVHGLKEAIYILDQLCGGKEKGVVIKEMHGDKQLVDMWINFLRHNYWIIYDHSKNEWMLTNKGKRWIEQIRKKHTTAITITTTAKIKQKLKEEPHIIFN